MEIYRLSFSFMRICMGAFYLILFICFLPITYFNVVHDGFVVVYCMHCFIIFTLSKAGGLFATRQSE